MKFARPMHRRHRGVYTVTDAQRPKSEDIDYRQRRYLISMGIRVVAFLLAVFLFHGVWRFVAAAVALVVPYFAVVFANGGREPDDAARFEPFDPNALERGVPTHGARAAGHTATPGSAGSAGGRKDARAPDHPDDAPEGSAARDRDGRDRTGADGNGRHGAGRDGAAPVSSHADGATHDGEGHAAAWRGD